jgi:hypothetical protein
MVLSTNKHFHNHDYYLYNYHFNDFNNTSFKPIGFKPICFKSTCFLTWDRRRCIRGWWISRRSRPFLFTCFIRTSLKFDVFNFDDDYHFHNFNTSFKPTCFKPHFKPHFKPICFKSACFLTWDRRRCIRRWWISRRSRPFLFTCFIRTSLKFDVFNNDDHDFHDFNNDRDLYNINNNDFHNFYATGFEPCTIVSTSIIFPTGIFPIPITIFLILIPIPITIFPLPLLILIPLLIPILITKF